MFFVSAKILCNGGISSDFGIDGGCGQLFLKKIGHRTKYRMLFLYI